jgi:hypothetical protein
MKYLTLGILIFLASCDNNSAEQSLAGIYIGHFEHQFAKNDDTLILKKANEGNGIYNLTRHTGLISKLDGKVLPKKNISENLIVEFSPDKQILTDVKEGRVLVWDKKTSTLQLGNTMYTKIRGF